MWFNFMLPWPDAWQTQVSLQCSCCCYRRVRLLHFVLSYSFMSIRSFFIYANLPSSNPAWLRPLASSVFLISDLPTFLFFFFYEIFSLNETEWECVSSSTPPSATCVCVLWPMALIPTLWYRITMDCLTQSSPCSPAQHSCSIQRCSLPLSSW